MLPGPKLRSEVCQARGRSDHGHAHRENVESANFKKYNFNSLGAPVAAARSTAHEGPLRVPAVLLQMGFEEMPTNRFVESSFWNFDALFQPQQHPARDAHDTFF